MADAEESRGLAEWRGFKTVKYDRDSEVSPGQSNKEAGQSEVGQGQ